MKQTYTSLILAGAAPDSGNHGVTALAKSAIAGLLDRGPFQITCLDNGDGLRIDHDFVAPRSIERAGFRPGKNILKRSNIWHARLSQTLGLPNPTISAIKNSAAVLDVSGGDSFSDIYGMARFNQVCAIKELALEMGRPLILLPQTIGPFKSDLAQERAKQLLGRASLVFARDQISFDRLRTLLQDQFDPRRHKLGVDLAFGLEADTKAIGLANHTAGLNVSGLLWNDPASAAQQFGITVDYRQLILSLIENLTSRGHPVLLVPHVVAPNSFECDLQASRALLAQLPARLTEKVHLYEGPFCPSTLKGLIRQTCWFAGARMHATIAALSSATPVVNMAYSDKAAGVFAGMAAGAQVADLRSGGTAKLLAQCLDAFSARDDQRRCLTATLPKTLDAWDRQMALIAKTAAGTEAHLNQEDAA